MGSVGLSGNYYSVGITGVDLLHKRTKRRQDGSSDVRWHCRDSSMFIRLEFKNHVLHEDTELLLLLSSSLSHYIQSLCMVLQQDSREKSKKNIFWININKAEYEQIPFSRVYTWCTQSCENLQVIKYGYFGSFVTISYIEGRVNYSPEATSEKPRWMYNGLKINVVLKAACKSRDYWYHRLHEKQKQRATATTLLNEPYHNI